MKSCLMTTLSIIMEMSWTVNKVKRWVKYSYQHFVEKIHGLDFCMPMATDTHRNSKTSTSDYWVYHMTDEKVLKKMLNDVGTDLKKRSFVDIGCGKGMCLKVACDLGCKRVAGIELDPRLAEICRKNIRKLELPAKVFEENAIDFTHYASFDLFYFYNPFNGNIFEKVIAAIKKSVEERPREIWVVYLCPHFHDLFIEEGFSVIGEEYDEVRDLKAYVYYFDGR